MSIFGIDYAFERPSSIGALKRDKVEFVCRYLAGGAGGSKEITRPEASELSHAGIPIVLVWETTAGRAGKGHEAGIRDAIAASRQAASIGAPPTRPIYFAVDFDARGPQVRAYFQGVRKILGGRTGVYAGYAPVKYLFDYHLIDYAWQTYAWSGGAWDHRAQLQQYSNDHTVAGVPCDLDRAVKADFGQWRQGWTPPSGHTLRGGDRGPAVKHLVNELMYLGYLPYPFLGRPRSRYGGWVNTAVARFRKDYKLGPGTDATDRVQAALAHAVAARRRHHFKPRRRPPLTIRRKT